MGGGGGPVVAVATVVLVVHMLDGHWEEGRENERDRTGSEEVKRASMCRSGVRVCVCHLRDA